MRVLTTNIADKKSYFFSRFILLLSVIFLFSISNVRAQAPGMLEFTGRTVKDGKPLSGAKVAIYRNGTTFQEDVTTGKSGKFRFFLLFGSDYKVTFTYPGCVEMYVMVYTSKLPKTGNDIFPLYQTEVPFFETTSQSVRIDKYKNPFTKIIYDGKKGFMDDEAYLAEFTKDVLINSAEQARIFAEKEAKEKAEKDAADAKKAAEEKTRKDAEEKLLAEQRAKADELAKEAELARLREAEANKQHENESMESAAMRLQREKEAKELLAKKNKEIKAKYETDLLKLVAENERLAKEKEFNKGKQEARANTVIEQMRRETELKAKADGLRDDIKLKKKKALQNQQFKMNEMRKLVEAAAFAQRSIRIGDQKIMPDPSGYVRKELPNVAVIIDDGIIKTTRTTVITQGKTLNTYTKDTYFWGNVSCYKNNIQIDEAAYNAEIDYFLSYRNK